MKRKYQILVTIAVPDFFVVFVVVYVSSHCSSCRRWNLPGHFPGFHPHGVQRPGQAEPLPAVRSAKTLTRQKRRPVALKDAVYSAQERQKKKQCLERHHPLSLQHHRALKPVSAATAGCTSSYLTWPKPLSSNSVCLAAVKTKGISLEWGGTFYKLCFPVGSITTSEWYSIKAFDRILNS